MMTEISLTADEILCPNCGGTGSTARLVKGNWAFTTCKMCNGLRHILVANIDEPNVLAQASDPPAANGGGEAIDLSSAERSKMIKHIDDLHEAHEEDIARIATLQTELAASKEREAGLRKFAARVRDALAPDTTFDRYVSYHLLWDLIEEAASALKAAGEGEQS